MFDLDLPLHSSFHRKSNALRSIDWQYDITLHDSSSCSLSAFTHFNQLHYLLSGTALSCFILSYPTLPCPTLPYPHPIIPHFVSFCPI